MFARIIFVRSNLFLLSIRSTARPKELYFITFGQALNKSSRWICICVGEFAEVETNDFGIRCDCGGYRCVSAMLQKLKRTLSKQKFRYVYITGTTSNLLVLIVNYWFGDTKF